MKYFKYEFLPPFVAIYRHNDISIFLSVGKYREEEMLNHYSKLQSRKRDIDLCSLNSRTLQLHLVGYKSGWSNILLEEHGCQEAERAFQNHELELAQMKLDELMEDVMNLDINKEFMEDNHGHSQDYSTVCSNFFNIDI